MAYSDRELLARIVQCEARTEKETIGMKAVASVTMNRVNSSEGEYARVSQGGNIRNIIFQEGHCDIDSIKFITISTTGIYGSMANNRYHYY